MPFGRAFGDPKTFPEHSQCERPMKPACGSNGEPKRYPDLPDTVMTVSHASEDWFDVGEPIGGGGG